jgi:hypothetical protein
LTPRVKDHRRSAIVGALAVVWTSVGLPFVFPAMIDRYSLPLRWLFALYAGGCIWMIRRR